MNTIVQRYVSGDLPMAAIVRTAPGIRSPLLKALLAILECLEGKRLAKDAIDAAESVPIEGSDPLLLILLLTSWAELSCRIARPSQAEALIHRARTLTPDSAPAEVLARVMYAESVFADMMGNKSECEKTLREILKLLPQSSSRRKFYVWELSMFLSLQGRGSECEAEIKTLQKLFNENFRPGLVTLVRFVNSVETGNISEAKRLKTEIQNDSDFLKDVSRNPFASYIALLDLMRDSIGKDFQRADGIQPQQNPVTWIRVLRALLSHDPAEALRLARVDANKLLGAIFESGFTSMNLVRAEISAGNWEAARRVMEMRHTKTTDHYLDDLFLARISFLAGDMQAAAGFFSKALDSARRYAALGRLSFELHLACELTPLDIIQLTQATMSSANQDQSPARRPAPASPARVTNSRGIDRIVGRASGMKDVCEMIRKLADIDAPVLITGETGTGKDLVARALFEESQRKDKPFLAVNCGAIAETLLESELFGHEKGAFTGAEKANKGLFEEAGEGTIFLDEIGEIPPRLQVALLRVLETGEIRAVGSGRTRKIGCRILMATNANLAELSSRGTFRKDLLYRLQRLGIHIPPLRERREDILPIARQFIDTGRREGAHASLSPEAIETITAYDWPGNVRELKNVIERMRLMHSDKLSYDLRDLDLKFQTSSSPLAGIPAQSTAQLPGQDDSLHTGDAGDSDRSRGGQLSGQPRSIDDFLRNGNSQIRRLDRLRALFLKHKKLTRNEAIELLDISPNTATKDIQALCDGDFIERVEPSKSTRSHYFVLKEK
ncbi:MAG: hypothetical protein C0404_00235 [Verrucomicrobia bacterium]|nr:hypothetical protein [Verrucomicrobiota bacterium]